MHIQQERKARKTVNYAHTAGFPLSPKQNIYNTAFQGKANFGYASALSFVVFILVAILAVINLKVGDKRD